MEHQMKYDLILDAFQELLENEDIQHISVNQIAKKAGIGKGSIYYYFSSKDEILYALIQRIYKNAITMAQDLQHQAHLPASTRIAQIFNSCRDASKEFLRKSTLSKENDTTLGRVNDVAFIHHQFMSYIIKKLKPVFSEIIHQAIEKGEVKFDFPEELADIILIVLTIKIDNTLSPSSEEEITRSLQALISLLERGTENPLGAFNLQV